jgi:hypothetical protein
VDSSNCSPDPNPTINKQANIPKDKHQIARTSSLQLLSVGWVDGRAELSSSRQT